MRIVLLVRVQVHLSKLGNKIDLLINPAESVPDRAPVSALDNFTEPKIVIPKLKANVSKDTMPETSLVNVNPQV